MGRFQSTEYIDTVNGITDTMNSFLDNPYYIHNDKKPYIVDYFPFNKQYTTLDEGSKTNYSFYDQNSPLRYDVIKNFVIYGSGNRIETNLNRDEYGLMTDDIDGEFIILPNTIVPIPGELFRISSIKDNCVLFKVTTVNQDTLPNGQNFYKINYQLETTEEYRFNELKTRIINTYHMIIDNIGTNSSLIMQDDSYNFLNNLDELSTRLKLYFKSLFYSSRVQTFIYKYTNDKPLYDFFMIEFIMNNHILDNDGEYIYICHQLQPPAKFPLVYNKSFYRCVEKKDLTRIRNYTYRAKPMYINDIRSIFNTRQEDYYYVCYDCVDVAKTVVPCFSDDLIYNIEHNIKFTECRLKIFNIIIKYFNDEEITQEDIDVFDDICFDDTIMVFYGIPVIIFCIEKYIQNAINAPKIDESKSKCDKCLL